MRMYNDDLVMALAIGCWVRDTALQENTRNMEYSKVFLNSMFVNKTEMNTAIPGQKGYKEVAKSDSIKQQREFIWLIKG